MKRQFPGPALAASAIVLALGVAPATIGAEEPRPPIEKPNLNAVNPIFDSRMLQSSIRADKTLDQIASEASILGATPPSFGFAARSEEARFFVIGALYSETLAHLHGGGEAAATKCLKSIEQEFIVMGVPRGLFSLISKTRNVAETKRYPDDALLDFASLFQPLFDDYAALQSDDKVVLFRAGSWLSDFGLAAAAGNTNVLRQEATLDYFIREMKRMNAPKGVQDALGEIETVVGHETIGPRDTIRILELVRKIQTMLA